jgi:predicted  nucleic acid-binding Zn-ribbon protein
MPASERIADLRQRLEQLNELDDEQSLIRRSEHSASNSEVLRESFRANLPLSVLTHHDRLRSRGRRSIAEVRNGVCSGCHMNLPTGLQAEVPEVQRKSMLLRCQTCGRFIFPVKEASEPPPANGPHPPKRAKK